jgi:hypothetical protein
MWLDSRGHRFAEVVLQLLVQRVAPALGKARFHSCAVT